MSMEQGEKKNCASFLSDRINSYQLNEDIMKKRSKKEDNKKRYVHLSYWLIPVHLFSPRIFDIIIGFRTHLYWRVFKKRFMYWYDPNLSSFLLMPEKGGGVTVILSSVYQIKDGYRVNLNDTYHNVHCTRCLIFMHQ